jgi:hypothetical protein
MLANEVHRGGFSDERFAHTLAGCASPRKIRKGRGGGEDSDDDDEISEELLYFSALGTVRVLRGQALTNEDFPMSLKFLCAHRPFPSQPSRCKMRRCTRRPRRLLPTSSKLFPWKSCEQPASATTQNTISLSRSSPLLFIIALQSSPIPLCRCFPRSPCFFPSSQSLTLILDCLPKRIPLVSPRLTCDVAFPDSTCASIIFMENNTSLIIVPRPRGTA